MAVAEHVTDVPYRIYGRRRRPRLRAAALGGTAALALAAAGLSANALATRGEVPRGVSVAGVDVGGLSREQARARIARELGARLGRPVTVRTPTGTAAVIPAQAGVAVDLDRAVALAFATGRLESRLLPAVWSADVPAPIVLRATALPAPLAPLTAEAVDAALELRRDGSGRVIPAREGRTFDTPAALAAIADAAVAERREIAVPVVPVAPGVPTARAEEALARAEALLARPVSIRFQGRRVARLAPDELAPLVRVGDASTGFALSLRPKGLARLLAPAAAKVERGPRNAFFKPDGKYARIAPDRDGLKIDAAATGAAIVAAADAGSAKVQVRVERIPAKVQTADLKELGIRVRLFTKPITTQMGASSANRIHNVHLLADILDGRIVKPGETFDFNKVVGQRTPERGFKVGQQIEGGRLVPAIGGGVCQVVTTLFDAAFYAGLEIKDRRNHDFYISHYPLGMDATVSWGGPEFRFKNTLKHAILIDTSATNTTMSIQLYGTREGITVTQKTGAPHSHTAAGERRIVDRTLPPGTEVREGGGSGGFTVTVYRTVRRKGKVIRRDEFTSRYVPQHVFVRYNPEKPEKQDPADPAAAGADAGGAADGA